MLIATPVEIMQFNGGSEELLYPQVCPGEMALAVSRV
jgi:hypothetical protein